MTDNQTRHSASSSVQPTFVHHQLIAATAALAAAHHRDPYHASSAVQTAFADAAVSLQTVHRFVQSLSNGVCSSEDMYESGAAEATGTNSADFELVAFHPAPQDFIITAVKLIADSAGRHKLHLKPRSSAHLNAGVPSSAQHTHSTSEPGANPGSRSEGAREDGSDVSRKSRSFPDQESQGDDHSDSELSSLSEDEADTSSISKAAIRNPRRKKAKKRARTNKRLHEDERVANICTSADDPFTANIGTTANDSSTASRPCKASEDMLEHHPSTSRSIPSSNTECNTQHSPPAVASQLQPPRVVPSPVSDQSRAQKRKKLKTSATQPDTLHGHLKAGNIPKVWHPGLILIHDILTVSPADPKQIVDEALMLVRPLQNDRLRHRSRHPGAPPGASLAATLSRLEQRHSEAKVADARKMIDLLHLFSLQRQSQVDTLTGRNPSAAQDFEAAQAEVRVRPGGLIAETARSTMAAGQTRVSVAISSVNGARPRLSTPREDGERDHRATSDDDPEHEAQPAQASTSTTQSTTPTSLLTQSKRDGANPKPTDVLASLMHNLLKSAKRWHELGSALGSVIFLPLIMLSPSMRSPESIRRWTKDQWRALLRLLRGDKPLPVHDGKPFTERDNEIVEALTFGVRAVLPRILGHAVAMADALCAGADGYYADVLVVRDVRSDCPLGNEEPSAVQPVLLPSTSADFFEEGGHLGDTRDQNPYPGRVYGLEVPGSSGNIEIITRIPGFICSDWRTNLHSKASFDAAFEPERESPDHPKTELTSESPHTFQANFADRRSYDLINCERQDVIPFARAYARHFGLNEQSKGFIALCDSVRQNKRIVGTPNIEATLGYLDERLLPSDALEEAP
ncbi:hypothetical protein OC842_005456 [Tilletia horrida]|uniref:Uncharacterized protein n=1 Tax=Tilletia horrida TaxID=155126 RepID=A0AAN6G9U0_9BASI|nr:hypothetical protein OC842_005456 [Tilletia horrida]